MQKYWNDSFVFVTNIIHTKFLNFCIYPPHKRVTKLTITKFYYVQCGKSFTENDVVVINGSDDDTTQNQYKMDNRRLLAKMAKVSVSLEKAKKKLKI